jgi:hypothetical protein
MKLIQTPCLNGSETSAISQLGPEPPTAAAAALRLITTLGGGLAFVLGFVLPTGRNESTLRYNRAVPSHKTCAISCETPLLRMFLRPVSIVVATP